MFTYSPEDFVSVKLSYADDRDKLALEAGEFGSSFKASVPGTIRLPIAEFLTYYLFYYKVASPNRFRNYLDVAEVYRDADKDLMFHEFDGGNLFIPRGNKPPAATAERIGEAVGMSVMNRVMGITAADWIKIPESRKKTLDYRYATDGRLVVQLEAKGRSNSLNLTELRDSISLKKSAAHKDVEIPIAPDILVGLATKVTLGRSAPLECVILDPPTEDRSENAAILRVIARSSFYLTMLEWVLPRSPFVAALRMRVYDIVDVFRRLRAAPFDNSPLPEFPPDVSGRSQALGLEGQKYFGIIERCSGSSLVFFGLSTDLLTVLKGQSFAALLSFKLNDTAASLRVTVDCVMPRRRFEAWRESSGVEIPEVDRVGNSYRFQATALVHFTIEGTAFGFIGPECILA